MAEPLSVVVELNTDDYMKLMRFVDIHTPGGRRRVRRLYLMGFAAYCIMAGVAMKDENHGLANPGQFAIYLASTALFLGAMYFVFLSWLRPTMTRASLNRPPRNQMLAPTTMTFEEDQLRLENEHGEGHMDWKNLREAVETEEYIFLVVGVTNAIVLPKRSFASEGDVCRCIAFLKAKQSG